MRLSIAAISDKQLDYALAADVLEHVRDRTRLLQEIAANLKPGGLLIASTGNIARPYCLMR
ncbi:MAG TPA: methyltransferase domain-containing protein [Candidatus Handelsmanbacteria bacterium]|nr:methyltransferase domain-containing protein [Candidatus Handelsmanbacteria bacterium]